MSDTYTHKNILYLPAKNKLWGSILSPSDCVMLDRRQKIFYKYFWCWWAIPGKNLSLCRHSYNHWSSDILERKKIKNGYEPIEEKQLLEMWPDFPEKLHHKMIFEVLSNHE